LFPIVLVPRYKLSLCHTPIKPDLLGFFGIGVFVCGLSDHVIMRFASFGIRAWLHQLGYILLKFLFHVDSAKNSLVSNFFFFLNLQHIKNFLFHSVIVQNISVALKTKKKSFLFFWILL